MDSFESLEEFYLSKLSDLDNDVAECAERENAHYRVKLHSRAECSRICVGDDEAE